MIAFFKRLFRRASIVVIDAETFGPRLPYDELQKIISGHPHVINAVQQVCLYRRELCQRAVEDKSNTLHGQTAFESGAAAGTTDLMATLEMIRQGKGGDDPMKLWFQVKKG